MSLFKESGEIGEYWAWKPADLAQILVPCTGWKLLAKSLNLSEPQFTPL